MKKFQLLVIAFLISLSICAIASTQVKAQTLPLSQFVVKTPISVTANVPFTLTVTAKDADLTTVTSFSGSVDLSAPPGSISPNRTGTSDWSNGVWSGLVTLTTAGFIAVSATDDSGHTGMAFLTVNIPLVAPSLSVSAGTVDRGQISSLTSSAVSTGTSPYTYQWLQKAPSAGSYSAISGATSGSYSFVTSGSTATGSWSFELQVTDTAGAVVDSSAVTVTVNVAPTVSVSPASWTMDVGQSRRLLLCFGGSGALSYQWYFDGSVVVGQIGTTLYVILLSSVGSSLDLL